MRTCCKRGNTSNNVSNFNLLMTGIEESLSSWHTFKNLFLIFSTNHLTSQCYNSLGVNRTIISCKKQIISLIHDYLISILFSGFHFCLVVYLKTIFGLEWISHPYYYFFVYFIRFFLTN